MCRALPHGLRQSQPAEAMKFYTRDPDAAIAGMAGLTLEQIGFYNLLLDFLYSRDGIVSADPRVLAKMMQRDPRQVCRLMVDLMAAGKIWSTDEGMITANRVDATRLRAEVRSMSARSSANVRWEKYRKTKQINGTAMRLGNAPIPTPIKESKKLSGEQRGKVEQLKTEPFG